MDDLEAKYLHDFIKDIIIDWTKHVSSGTIAKAYLEYVVHLSEQENLGYLRWCKSSIKSKEEWFDHLNKLAIDETLGFT